MLETDASSAKRPEEMTASKCYCRSPVGAGALMGASLTCGSDEIPFLLRPCSIKAPPAALYLPSLHATRDAWAFPHWKDEC